MVDAVRQWHDRHRGLIGPAVLFVCALLMGGGGPHAPLLVAFLEGLAFLFLVYAVARGRGLHLATPALVGLLIATAYLVCGSLQLVPLKPDTWHALPGRQLLRMTMRASGREDGAWPVSLSPQDTRDVLLALLPPLTIFLLTASLPPRSRLTLAILAVAAAAVSAVLGVLQLAAGDGSFFVYVLPPFNRLPGLFASFNHQATFLATGFILVVAIWVERPGRTLPVQVGFVVLLGLLAIGTLITSSRAGIGLLLAAGAASLLLWVSARSARRTLDGVRGSRPRNAVGIVAALVAIGLLGLVFVGSYRGDLMANRFGEAVDDLRFTFWVNTVQAIRQVSPVGSGLGTFDFVYQAVQPLDQIASSYVNHAHNDYLELVLELGWAGAVLIVLAFAWVGWRLVAAIRRPLLEPGVALARAGGVVALLVMAHSIVDYPLRTETVGCLFAYACALLVNVPGSAGRERVRSRVRQGSRVRTVSPAIHAR